MRSASNSRWQTLFSALLSLVIATGLWYLVVGRDHVETQVELRVEYRGLPSGLVVGDGLINQLSVRTYLLSLRNKKQVSHHHVKNRNLAHLASAHNAAKALSALSA